MHAMMQFWDFFVARARIFISVKSKQNKLWRGVVFNQSKSQKLKLLQFKMAEESPDQPIVIEEDELKDILAGQLVAQTEQFEIIITGSQDDESEASFGFDIQKFVQEECDRLNSEETSKENAKLLNVSTNKLAFVAIQENIEENADEGQLGDDEDDEDYKPSTSKKQKKSTKSKLSDKLKGAKASANAAKNRILKNSLLAKIKSVIPGMSPKIEGAAVSL